MSIRGNIVSQLETGFQTILTSNGYRTDIGLDVHKWEDIPINQSETQYLTFKDGKDSVDTEMTKEHGHTLSVSVEVFFSGSSAVDSCRDAIDDVYEWLGKDENQFLGGNCEYVDYVESDIERSRDVQEQITATGLISLEVSFITHAFKPDAKGYTK